MNAKFKRTKEITAQYRYIAIIYKSIKEKRRVDSSITSKLHDSRVQYRIDG